MYKKNNVFEIFINIPLKNNTVSNKNKKKKHKFRARLAKKMLFIHFTLRIEMNEINFKTARQFVDVDFVSRELISIEPVALVYETKLNEYTTATFCIDLIKCLNTSRCYVVRCVNVFARFHIAQIIDTPRTESAYTFH